MTDQEILTDLQEIKLDCSYSIERWSLAVAKHFYAKGQKELAKEWMARLEKEDEIICAGFLKTWAQQGGLLE